MKLLVNKTLLDQILKAHKESFSMQRKSSNLTAVELNKKQNCKSTKHCANFSKILVYKVQIFYLAGVPTVSHLQTRFLENRTNLILLF